MIKNFAFALVVLVLAACTVPDPGRVPPLSLDGVQPISLNVAAIEVYDEYRAPMQAPNVDHLFKTPPISAIRKLLERQLVAAGTANTLRVIIEDASVVNQDLPVTTGVAGAFKREPSNVYRAKVSVRFELIDPAAPDLIIGRATVIGKRNRTMLKGDSLAERDRAAYELTRELMQDVGDGLDTIVKNTFGTR